MDEAFSYAIPDSFYVAGVAAEASRPILLWAANQDYLIARERQTQRIIGKGVLKSPISAAWIQEGSAVEVVDSGRVAILRLRPSGDLLTEYPLKLPIALEQAVRTTAGWYVGGHSASGDYEIHLISPDQSAQRVYRLPLSLYQSDRPMPVHLSRAGEDILATLLEPSFATVRLGSRGEVRQVFQPERIGTLEEQTGEDSAGDWMSLSTLRLDGGFLQNLVDLRSDARVLILYDAQGKVRRHTTMDVPMGFVASVPGEHLLLAIRRVGGVELVGYNWRWSEQN